MHAAHGAPLPQNSAGGLGNERHGNSSTLGKSPTGKLGQGPQSPIAIASTRTPTSTSRWASVTQRSHGRSGTLRSCFDHAHTSRARHSATSAPHTQRGTASSLCEVVHDL